MNLVTQYEEFAETQKNNDDITRNLIIQLMNSELHQSKKSQNYFRKMLKHHDDNALKSQNMINESIESAQKLNNNPDFQTLYALYNDVSDQLHKKLPDEIENIDKIVDTIVGATLN